MAERANPLLVFGLLAAVGVFLMARTKTGQSITQAAIDTAASAVDSATRAMFPRGIRNNNPGNIERTGVAWVGMAADQSSDDRFIVFTAPEYGVRAMARILKNYMASGYTNVASIINRWAPPTENVTSAYVAAVARKIGVDPNARIDASYIPDLIEAIIQHENGEQPYPPDLIARGVDMERTA
jgi:hypothetical protein